MLISERTFERCQGAAAPSASQHVVRNGRNPLFVMQSEGDGCLSQHGSMKTVVFAPECIFSRSPQITCPGFFFFFARGLVQV